MSDIETTVKETEAVSVSDNKSDSVVNSKEARKSDVIAPLRPYMFQKGHKKVGGAKKGQKYFPSILKKMLKEKTLTPNGTMSLGDAISYAVARKGAKGDVRAFEAIRDTIDGKPMQATEVSFVEPPLPILSLPNRKIPSNSKDI